MLPRMSSVPCSDFATMKSQIPRAFRRSNSGRTPKYTLVQNERMRLWLLSICAIALAGIAAADEPLGPADYLKILTESKVRYSIARQPSFSEVGKCSLMMSLTDWLRCTSDGPRSNLKTPST